MRRGLVKLFASVIVMSLAAVLLTACAQDEEDASKAVVATYGDQKIYLDEAEFYARQTQYVYEMYYGSVYGSELWTMDMGGSTLEDSVKETAMQTVMQAHVLASHAEDYNVSLTDQEKTIVTESVDSFLEEQPESLLNVLSITKERLQEIYEVNALANKVYEAMIADVDTNVDKKEAQQCTVQYVLVPEDDETYTDGEATVKEIAGKITKKKTISDVTEEYTGLTVTSDSYSVNDEQYKQDDADALGALAVTMKPGDVETLQVEGTGWYVVYCESDNDEEATQTEIERIISERESTMFREKYEELSKEDFKVDEDVWARVSFADSPTYETEAQADTAEDTDTDDNAESENQTDGQTESDSEN